MASQAELRRQLGALTSLAGNDLAAIWRELDRGSFAGEALYDLLPDLVERYGSAAASITADWYDELRTAAAVRARFTAIPAEIRDSGAEALIGWATSQTDDPAILKQLIAGGMTRRILNYSRQTVMGSSISDPSARGWQRIGNGANCTFCNMLIGRGAVYSEASADFASHDHCNCDATPAWVDRPVPVKPYVVGPRNGNQADYDRARAWMATNL